MGGFRTARPPSCSPKRGTRAGLTRFPHEHLLGRAGGSLAHRVVDAHPDLIAPVLAQVWGTKGERDPDRDGAAHGAPGKAPLVGGVPKEQLEGTGRV